jgi:CubicO group peptidase (beta-lactamase class C family)
MSWPDEVRTRRRFVATWWIPAVLLTLLGGALGVIRPWAPYSPLGLMTLFDPDVRVENFRSMHRIMPSRTVHAADTPFRFARAERPLEVEYDFDGERRTLESFLERVAATGLLVVADDTIVTERYFLGADERTTFTSWSMAKSFVSTLVGMTLGDGLIESLDDPISRYAPELERSAYAGVPIRHVLQMSSGVDFDERYARRTSDINLFFAKIFALGRRADDVVFDYGRDGPSGEVFHYVSLDTHALGLMLRRIHGKPLAALLEERIWRPLGMEGDARWNVDDDGPDGAEIGFCCLNARLRDYAKLGRLYLRKGDWGGERLLPAGWTAEATRPSAPHLEPGASPYGYGRRGYQYQWWSPERPEGEYFAAGVWGQYVYVSEPDRLIVVRTSVDPEFRAHMEETVVVFRAIRDALRRGEQ